MLASTTFRALGTSATVAVAEPTALHEGRRLLAAHLADIDLACSRFRPDSELVRLGASQGRPVAASASLRDALREALRVARLTDGLVSPSLGVSLVAAGYDRDLGTLKPVSAPAAFRPAGDWRDIRIDDAAETVQVPRGVLLDLGATAKARAADRAAAAIARTVGCGVLVSLGGDIRVAGVPPSGGWPVLVDDVHDAITAAAEPLLLATGALATSSTVRRRWSRAGASLHHILDPLTGAPASGPWRTVSVAARTCVDANAAATAAILLGADAPDWLASRRLPARLVAHAGDVLRTAGWPLPCSSAAA